MKRRYQPFICIRAKKLTRIRILLPTDKTFQDCIELLNKTQGDTIRKFSLAVEGVVLSIFEGTLSGLSAFPIENVERAQILSQPKGSDELLKLLSSAP
jgi:hypothetical protein